MGEARDQASAGNDSVPPRVFGAALMAGGLLASLVAVAARHETGFPPGVTPPPFARLIGQPAPAFSLGGLQGATVSPVDAPAGGAWLLFFAEASCQGPLRGAVRRSRERRFMVRLLSGPWVWGGPSTIDAPHFMEFPFIGSFTP